MSRKLQSILHEVRTGTPTGLGHEKASRKRSTATAAPQYPPDVLAARAIKMEGLDETIGEHLDEFDTFRDVNGRTFDELVEMNVQASLKGALRPARFAAGSTPRAAGTRSNSLVFRAKAEEGTGSIMSSHPHSGGSSPTGLQTRLPSSASTVQHGALPPFLPGLNSSLQSRINQTYTGGVAASSPLRNEVMDIDIIPGAAQHSGEGIIDEASPVYGVFGRKGETLQVNGRKLHRLKNDSEDQSRPQSRRRSPNYDDDVEMAD